MTIFTGRRIYESSLIRPLIKNQCTVKLRNSVSGLRLFPTGHISEERQGRGRRCAPLVVFTKLDNYSLSRAAGLRPVVSASNGIEPGTAGPWNPGP